MVFIMLTTCFKSVKTQTLNHEKNTVTLEKRKLEDTTLRCDSVN